MTTTPAASILERFRASFQAARVRAAASHREDMYIHQRRMEALLNRGPLPSSLAEQVQRGLQDRVNETLRPILPKSDAPMGPWTQVAMWKHRAMEAEAKLARSRATVHRITVLARTGHVAFSELTDSLGWRGHNHMTRDIQAPGLCPRCDNPNN